MTYDNTNSGAIFINHKRDSEKSPNMRGSINVEGVEYWVSAWTNKKNDGEKYISMKFTAKDSQATGVEKKSFDNVEDDWLDLPF